MQSYLGTLHAQESEVMHRQAAVTYVQRRIVVSFIHREDTLTFASAFCLSKNSASYSFWVANDHSSSHSGGRLQKLDTWIDSRVTRRHS